MKLSDFLKGSDTHSGADQSEGISSPNHNGPAYSATATSISKGPQASHEQRAREETSILFAVGFKVPDTE